MMTATVDSKRQIAKAIVVGIGSAHGDDQVGWVVADALRAAQLEGIVIRNLKSPVDLVNCLCEAKQCHVVDAVANPTDRINPVDRRRLADPLDRAVLEKVDFAGTHDFGLVQSFSLAESLGISLDHVSVWLIGAEKFGPLSEISPTAARNATQCVNRLRAELSDA